MIRIRSKYVCICDRKRPELASVIASYLSEPGCYLPLYEFPFVSTSYRAVSPDAIDEGSLSIQRAEGTIITINNAIARMGGCELLIFAGLSEHQKSFLGIWRSRNHIFIDDLNQIDFLLSPHTEKKEVLACKSTSIIAGLFMALKSGKLLNLDDTAKPIKLERYISKQLVVAEDDGSVASLSAAMYAFASASDLMVVPAISPDELEQVFDSIRARKTSALVYGALEDMVNGRLAGIEVSKYITATFFTIGLPYSHILKNMLPMSYVNLHGDADHFVVNSLLWEQQEKFGGAIVFSPVVFKNEETKPVIDHLTKQGYYVKTLLDKEATAFNLHMNLKEFPFDLLHICSHGGEIKGSRIKLKFTDINGAEHQVEYESVLSISPIPGKDKYLVQEKWFPRKVDGFQWASSELKAIENYRNVIESMHLAIKDALAKDKELLEKDVVVATSTSIHCIDDNYQAMIQLIASQTSPIIFNNTCWSWYHIAQQFLLGGARGYIGCLWNINNKDAVTFATTFYDKVFSSTVIDAFFSGCKSIDGSDSENAYIYWGLPFTTLQATELKESRNRIMAQLSSTYLRYEMNADKINDTAVMDAIKPILDWIEREIMTNFKGEFKADIERKKKLLEERKKNKE